MNDCHNCPNRTIEPNCHNTERCEKWAAHVARVQANYARRKEAMENKRPLSTYSKSRNKYQAHA